MIWLYSGTPGSGKSFHAAQDIYNKLNRKIKKNINKSRVISNFPFNLKNDNFHELDNSELTVEYLKEFAIKNHAQKHEAQTLVVIDEAQILFNSRDWNSSGSQRMDWITFFSQHRKYGYNFILIAQFDRMLDRQIRCLIEYEILHMKISNYFKLLPFTSFLAVTRWYGQKMKINHEIIIYRKKIADLYNTFDTFDSTEKKEGIEKETEEEINEELVDPELAKTN